MMHDKARHLTPKQARFVAEYLIDLNATQAAIRAGYNPKWAHKNATRLTANDGIAAAIAAKTERQAEKLELTAEMVKARLRAIAFQDIRSIFDAHGNLRPIHELTADEAAMVGGVEVIIKNAKAGDGVTDTIHKVKAIDPVKPLEILAKHFGLLVERVDIQGGLEITWKPTQD